jgi:hypothetical protein
MAGQGYSYVSDIGFIAFSHDLENGEWKAVSVKKYDQEDSMAGASLAAAPLAVAWKLRALWGIRALAAAAGADVMAALDAEWDSSQRALNLAVGAAEEAKEENVRAAAGRVRAALLAGGGTSQTLLSYDQEVDFARDQLKKVAEKAMTADVKLIGVDKHLDRIEAATKALAKGLGRDEGKSRSPSRARRIRDALAACSSAFNGIHDEIAWAIEHTADKDERARLQALLLPFEQLLERYPSAPAVALGGDTAAPQVSPTVPAPTPA